MSDEPQTKSRLLRTLVLVWALGGVCWILLKPIVRLSGLVTEAFRMELHPAHWIFVVPWVLFMGYSEGYRGFQHRFAPRVVARAWSLAERPRPLRLLLAPFFCVGYFAGTKRRMITSWSVTFGISLIVMVVSRVPQPWRGLVDLGVLVGLAWGVVSVLTTAAAAARGAELADPQLPVGG